VIVRLLANISYYIPELIAIVTMCGLLFLEATYDRNEKKRGYIFTSSLIGLSFCIAAIIGNIGLEPSFIFSQAVVIDQFSTWMKLLMSIALLGVILLHFQSKDVDQDQKSEFVILAFGVLIGGFLLSSATNFLTLYLGIEILSILSYVMASLNKEDSMSTEAGIKYVLYGGVSAGIMLFGISFLYGVFGSINFTDMITLLPNLTQQQLIICIVSLIFVLVGMGYKVSCFPFHMWAPDVYQGSPIPVTCFFALVPKIAGIAALARFTQILFIDNSHMVTVTWNSILVVIIIFTMIVGNLSALNQDSVKRMLAYSSIGHVGVILMGVMVMGEEGNRAILFYSFAYIFMTLVAFLAVSVINDTYKNDSHNCFKGLIKKKPLLAICFAVSLLSLAGLPPFSGFIAKFHMISVAISKKYYGLSIVAAITSVISLYYYLRLVKFMIIDETEDGVDILGFDLSKVVTFIGFTLPIIVFGLFWERVFVWFDNAKIMLSF
jgi:NADH-quinone oxidoreductase subunit N